MKCNTIPVLVNSAKCNENDPLTYAHFERNAKPSIFLVCNFILEIK